MIIINPIPKIIFYKFQYLFTIRNKSHKKRKNALIRVI